MVERADIDQRQRLLQRLREQLVGPAGLGNAGRMIVRKDHRGRIARERSLDDLPWVNAGLRERTAKEFVRGEQPVLAVEKQSYEHFVGPRREQQPQIIADSLRRGERIARARFLGQRSPGKLDNSRKLRAFRLTDAVHRRDLGNRRCQESRHTTETGDEIARKFKSAAARHARAQEKRNQFGIGKCPGATREQPLARSLAVRPFADTRCHRFHSGPLSLSTRAVRAQQVSPRQCKLRAVVFALAFGMMETKSFSRIVLGLTGGIAAYKAAELTRLYVKAGIAVDVCMTAAACRFIAPLTLQALSGRPVLTDLWASGCDNGMGHINLSRGADAIVVAPASANFLAKVANGHADDLLSTLALARYCALFVAPAMNRQMWANAANQRNIAQLVADGVMVLGPGSGDQACGETGDGRMLEPEEIFAAVLAWAQPKLLAGRKVLLTAGPTFEAIDPVRGITNTSSGKMGYALAQAAAEAGAMVTLVSGPTSLPTPAEVTRIDVVSAAQMAAAVDANLIGVDAFIAVAAVADYTPDTPAENKIKKSDTPLTITMKPTVDILATVAARPAAPYCVGFAAETNDVERNADEKRRRKKLPLIVANRVQEAFGADDNEVVLFDDTGRHPLPRMDKLSLARRLIAEIARRLPPR